MPSMRLSRRPRSVRISSFTGTYSVKLAKRPSDVGIGVAPAQCQRPCASEPHPDDAAPPVLGYDATTPFRWHHSQTSERKNSLINA